MSKAKLLFGLLLVAFAMIITIVPAEAAYLEFDRPSQSCPFYIPGPRLPPPAETNINRGGMWGLIPVRVKREAGDVGTITITPGTPWAPNVGTPQGSGALNVKWVGDDGITRQAYNIVDYVLSAGPEISSSEEDPEPTGYFYFRFVNLNALSTEHPTQATPMILSFPGKSPMSTLRTTPLIGAWDRNIIALPTISVLESSTEVVTGYFTLGVSILNATLQQTQVEVLLQNNQVNLGTITLPNNQTPEGFAVLDGKFQSNPDRDLSQAIIPPDVTLDNFGDWPIYSNGFYEFQVTPSGLANAGDFMQITATRLNFGPNPNPMTPLLYPGTGGGISFVNRFIVFTNPTVKTTPEGGTVSADFLITQSSPFTEPMNIFFEVTGGTAIAGEDYETVTVEGQTFIRHSRSSSGGVFLKQGSTQGSLSIATLRNNMFDPVRDIIIERAFAQPLDGGALVEIPFGYSTMNTDEFPKTLTVNITETGTWPYLQYRNSRVFIPANDPTTNVDIVASTACYVTMEAEVRAMNPKNYFPKKGVVEIPPGLTAPVDPGTQLTFSNPYGYTQYLTFGITRNTYSYLGANRYCTYEIEGQESFIISQRLYSKNVDPIPGKYIDIKLELVSDLFETTGIKVLSKKDAPIYIPVTYTQATVNGAVYGVDYYGPSELVIPAGKTSATMRIYLTNISFTGAQKDFTVNFGDALISGSEVSWQNDDYKSIPCGIIPEDVKTPSGIIVPTTTLTLQPETVTPFSVAFNMGSVLGDVSIEVAGSSKNYEVTLSLDGTTYSNRILVQDVGLNQKPFDIKVESISNLNYTGNSSFTLKMRSGKYSKNVTIKIVDRRPLAGFIPNAFVYDQTSTYTIDAMNYVSNATAIATGNRILGVYPNITTAPYSAFNLTGCFIGTPPNISQPATGDQDITIAQLTSTLNPTDIGTFDLVYGVENYFEEGVGTNTANITIGGSNTRAYPGATITVPYTSKSSYYAEYYTPLTVSASASKLLKKVSLKASADPAVPGNYVVTLNKMPILYNKSSYNAQQRAGEFSFSNLIMSTEQNPIAVNIYQKTGADISLISTKLLMPPGPIDEVNATVFTHFNTWSYIVNAANPATPLPATTSDISLHPGSIVAIEGNFFGTTPKVWIENTTYGAGKPRRAYCTILSKTDPSGSNSTSRLLVQLPTKYPGNWQFNAVDEENATSGLNAIVVSSGIQFAGGNILLKQLTANNNTQPLWGGNFNVVITDELTEIPLTLEKLDNPNITPTTRNGNYAVADVDGDPLKCTILNVAIGAGTNGAGTTPGDLSYGNKGFKIVKNASGGYSLMFKRYKYVTQGATATVTIQFIESNSGNFQTPVTGDITIILQ